MWLQRRKILPFHETCPIALAIARRISLQAGSSEVNAVHLLKGVMHCGDARVAGVFHKLKLDYQDEVNKACASLGEQGNQTEHTSTTYTNEVKKILARGNRCAQSKKRKEITALDLLVGIVQESPESVSAALMERGISLPQVGEMTAEAEQAPPSEGETPPI